MVTKSISVLKGDGSMQGTIHLDQKGNEHVGSLCQSNRLMDGLRGFHIHQVGEMPKVVSVLHHINPPSKNHGGPQDAELHAGVLRKATSGPDGVAEVPAEDSDLTAGSPSHSGFMVGTPEKEDLDRG
ncbi:superoxide dismutase [Cu-Zn]-like [Echinops telfairi]|uniref:Superoxide dismutase [Cu-Zn]-like n=1 Tax=Echinops telfairi TaxID=9371 RepID=A0AC55DGR4_ECHTE|nr:superoxide dismutase [Cu-Zn]-like [Echinops telfairi]